MGRGLRSLGQSSSPHFGPLLINHPSSSSDSSHFKEDSQDTFPSHQKNDVIPAAYQASPLPLPMLNLGLFTLYSCLTLHNYYQKKSCISINFTLPSGDNVPLQGCGFRTKDGWR